MYLDCVDKQSRLLRFGDTDNYVYLEGETGIMYAGPAGNLVDVTGPVYEGQPPEPGFEVGNHCLFLTGPYPVTNPEHAFRQLLPEVNIENYRVEKTPVGYRVSLKHQG